MNIEKCSHDSHNKIGFAKTVRLQGEKKVSYSMTYSIVDYPKRVKIPRFLIGVITIKYEYLRGI